ncbi:hypothetical protein B0O99DRAFT_686325 [Bisporella sp. PMI_857]|jgi:aryl-alcohol dehydrogenase-like predicted oxidoreductase|nr:hypothetical protein B0O99DRAFT_686325 [Bisporella sp. PMI_857]
MTLSDRGGLQGTRDKQRGRKGKPKAVERAASKVLEKIAHAKDKALASIAIAYVLHKTSHMLLLVGGRKVEHILGNIQALETELDEADMAKIESAYRFDAGFPHPFLSGSLWRRR